MKLKLYVDSGANIHSKRTETIDLEKDWGLTDEDWSDMTEKEKDEMVQQWVWERASYGFEEIN